MSRESPDEREDRRRQRPQRDQRDRLSHPSPKAPAPALAGAVERLAERARAESWSHEGFLAACLQHEVAACDAHSDEGRIRSARFPSRKSLEKFDFEHQRSLKRETITHLGRLDFIAGKDNVVFLSRPALARHTCRSASGSAPAKPATASRSPPPPNGSPASPKPTTPGRLQAEMVKLGRIPLIIIDEVGYVPFEAEAANLFFQLVSSRYERASLIVTSNKPFGCWRSSATSSPQP